MSFFDMVSDVGFGIFTIPFISTLDHIAVSGAFSRGKTLDATQEIFALGMVNIVGSLFGWESLSVLWIYEVIPLVHFQYNNKFNWGHAKHGYRNILVLWYLEEKPLIFKSDWIVAIDVVSQDEVAEWLRRWTANPIGSPSEGSNPFLVAPFLFYFRLFLINPEKLLHISRKH